MLAKTWVIDSKSNIALPEYNIVGANDSKAKKTFKGIPAPAFASAEYLTQLNKILSQANKDIKLLLFPPLKKHESRYTVDSWVDNIVNAINKLKSKYSNVTFTAFCEKIATKFVTSVDKYNQRKSTLNFGINALNQRKTNDFIKISVINNVNLIKSIPSDFFEEIEEAVLREITAGTSYKNLQDFIYNRYDVSKSRAKLIAVDQTAKVNGQLTVKRQGDAGFEFFRWQTVQDERVRSSHQHLADRVTKYGKGIYRLDAPPKGLKNRTIIPGFEFRCRCLSIPVLSKDVESGRYL